MNANNYVLHCIAYLFQGVEISTGKLQEQLSI